jgi:hypothetical protein
MSLAIGEHHLSFVSDFCLPAASEQLSAEYHLEVNWRFVLLPLRLSGFNNS